MAAVSQCKGKPGLDFQILQYLLFNTSFAGETAAVDDNKASRSVVIEILQNVVTGQSAAEPTGKGSENTPVYCGKTKVFMANSVVRMPFPQLTVLECTCVAGVLTVSAWMTAFPGFCW